MWYKPAAALANPNGVVHVPARLQERFPDFEVCEKKSASLILLFLAFRRMQSGSLFASQRY